MGIPDLWREIGDGDVEALADIATNHWRTHNRPFRLAIDEAGWRFNNLTTYQVQKIREKSDPRANPIEKAILWRILGLLRLGIQPVFVFDGPGRPWKHGSGAGKIDYDRTRLLRGLLDNLNIRHHYAPGEAEAECARFQERGIVDAVWSDDGDTLMFGATILFRSHKNEKSAAAKSKTHVRVYKADKIKQKFRLDRSSLVLFSLLAGGDYNEKGLEGCGAGTAFTAVRWQEGRLAKALASADLRQLSPFTAQLAEYFQQHSRSRFHIPPDFPRALHVGHYRDPKVTEGFDQIQEQAEKIAKLWDAEIDEGKLRAFLRESFDIQTKEYIRHVVPILLVNRMIKKPPIDVEARRQLDITLVQNRGKNADDYKIERLLTFNPLACSKLDLKTRPRDIEDWTKHTKKKTGEEWDPCEYIEIEMLDIFLERGLGAVEMVLLKDEASQPKPNKRKNATGGDVGGSGNEDDNFEQVTESSAPATKRQKSNKVAPIDPDTSTRSEIEPANTKRKTQPKTNSAQACQGPSPELGESPSDLQAQLAMAGSANPATKKRKSSSGKESDRGRKASTNQQPVFRLPTAIQRLTADQRVELQQEGGRVWYTDDARKGRVTPSAKPPHPSEPRHTPPPASFGETTRTNLAQFNGSTPSLFASLASPSLSLSPVAKTHSRIVVPKPAATRRVDSGTEIVDLCLDEHQDMPPGTISEILSPQERKDRELARHEARVRKRITEREFDYKKKDPGGIARKTVHQKLEKHRRSLLKLLDDEAVNVIEKLNDILAAGVVSISPQERELVHDQVVQFRSALELCMDAMTDTFAEACAMDNVFHGDTGNMKSTSPPPLTNPTTKDDLSVMKFALGVDIDLELKSPLLKSYSKGPKADPVAPWSAHQVSGSNDIVKTSMTDERPSKYSRSIAFESPSRQPEASACGSPSNMYTQDHQTATPREYRAGRDGSTIKINQRSTRSSGSVGLVRPRNWAKVVERSVPLEVGVEPAATALTSTQDVLESSIPDRIETPSNRTYATVSQPHKHDPGSTMAAASAGAQPAIHDKGDYDMDDEESENDSFNDYEIQEALRRSEQDQFATANSSVFASSSRVAHPSLSSRSKAQLADFSEPSDSTLSVSHDWAGAEHEQPISYTGKGKAPMYPSLHSMAASSDGLAGAFPVQQQEQQNSFASPPTSGSTQVLSAFSDRSPTAVPVSTWACINKPYSLQQSASSNALLYSLTPTNNASPQVTATASTQATTSTPVSAAISGQDYLPRQYLETAKPREQTGARYRQAVAAARVAHFNNVLQPVHPSSAVPITAANITKAVVRPREVIDLSEETDEEKAAAVKKRQREKERKRKENRASLNTAREKGKGVCVDLTLD